MALNYLAAYNADTIKSNLNIIMLSDQVFIDSLSLAVIQEIEKIAYMVYS